MQIGEMDTRVVFLEPIDRSDRTGEPVIEFAPRIPAWAKVESSDVRDQPRFRQPGMKASAVLRVRQTVGVREITDAWAVMFCGKHHAIESISHPDREWTVVGIYRKEP